MPGEDQEFIVRLIEASGSLKEMARIYGISYPTMRNRLDSLIDKIAQIRKNTDAEEGGDTWAHMGIPSKKPNILLRQKDSWTNIKKNEP